MHFYVCMDIIRLIYCDLKENNERFIVYWRDLLSRWLFISFFVEIMQNFYGLMRKKKDNWWTMIGLAVLFLLLFLNSIIKSGHLLFFVLCLLSWIFIYFIFNRREKKNRDKPASLWRDFLKKYPIIIQYAPPKWINPAEAWLLYNCKVDSTDLTSLIYQWKFENLIEIKSFLWKESKKEYIKLIKKEDMPLTRPLFETEIFDSIFSMGNIKIIEWPFQLRYALMLEDLEYHWIKKWWIFRPTLSVKWKYIYNILVVLLFIWVYMLFSARFWNHFSQILVLLVILFFACVFLWWLAYWWWKLRFTDKWAKLASHLIGYRNFIKSCDENKIKLLLKDDPLFVDRTLPYATAFWLETEFLKKVSPLRKDWNAKYVRWQKVLDLTILRFFFWGWDDNSFF